MRHNFAISLRFVLGEYKDNKNISAHITASSQ
jgi:hypothetical protein